tara:strand:+ start:1226 stop:1411 length:186 start_codon:yes stop_codon:yes gene_type:complete
MITTHDKIKVLKQRAEDKSIPLSDKADVIEFFKKYNDIFYFEVNIDAFYKDLERLSNEHKH